MKPSAIEFLKVILFVIASCLGGDNEDEHKGE